MDLSGLKWPAIILAVSGVIWLASSGGVNYVVGGFTKATPGQDAARDKRDEAGLTSMGTYLMWTLRYEKAAEVLGTATERYSTRGANYYYNQLRLAKCWEKLKRMQKAYDILRDLAEVNAKQYDDRLPTQAELTARAAKLKEVNDLQ